MSEVDKLVAEAEVDIINRGRYVPGRLSSYQLSQIDSRFNKTILDLRDKEYDTKELEGRYNESKRNFTQQREENMLKLNQERRMRGMKKMDLVHKVVLTASALATGIGIYATSLGYHSDNKNLTIGGAITLITGLGGLVYSFLRK